MQVTSSSSTKDRMVGLSNGDSDQTTADIDFAIDQAPSGALKLFEGGVQVGPTNLTRVQGDILDVEVVGGVVRYVKNDVVLYTSSREPLYPLRADASIKNTNAQVESVMISGALQYVAGTADAVDDGLSQQSDHGRLQPRRRRHRLRDDA